MFYIEVITPLRVCKMSTKIPNNSILTRNRATIIYIHSKNKIINICIIYHHNTCYIGMIFGYVIANMGDNKMLKIRVSIGHGLNYFVNKNA